MASGIFAILDDIASLMDDVAMSSKIATQKTAGILGDDLAVNAEKATGFLSSRELPVLWAITKGSFLNKLIIIPIALLLNYFFPIAIKIILVFGGLFLAFEGVEKIIEYLFHRTEKVGEDEGPVSEDNSLEAEKVKVKSAITTDFILSIEIVIMALGTVLDKSIGTQILTVTFVAFLATVGVYGIVALIVRMDDAGFNLLKRSNNKGFLSSLGNLLIKALPIVIRLLGVVGTIALIMVSGGILVHNIDFLHHLLPQVPSLVKEIASGLIAGVLVVFVVKMFGKILSVFKKK